jgi:membrane fusion protein (multidrug efflux system)
MKKLIIPLLLVTLLPFACQRERTAQQISAEVVNTRKQIATLSAKLESLEAELARVQPPREETPVKVTRYTVRKQDFSDYIESNSLVEAVREASISPEMSGKVESILVEEGQVVKKGDVLIKLDSKVMQGSLAELEKNFEMVNTTFEKQKELWDQGIGSEMQFLQAKNRKEAMERSINTLKSQLDLTKIFAPFDGRVEKISIKIGELASPGRGIIDVVNVSTLYVNSEVSEAFIETVHSGDTVRVEFPNLPGIVKMEPIIYKGDVISAQSRTFPVRVEIHNENRQIKPNMLADMKIRVVHMKDAVLVPTPLIRQDVQGSYVFTVQEKNSKALAHKVYITTGDSDGSMTVVKNGLEGGEILVDKGFNQVKEGTPLIWD